jgi:DNA-binding transcriptional LysR family regulator
MELRKLRHAATLAQYLNFTKAADALNLTQSALSRSIQALEDEVQLRLFDRNRNAVAITAVGKEFVQQAQILLRQEAELLELVSNTARGEGGSVALGIAPLASRTLLAPLMSEMIAKPGFHATVTIGTVRKLLPMLLDESVHICVCTGIDLAANALLESVPLARFAIGVLVRADHPLTRLTNISAKDLDKYPLLRSRPNALDEEESSHVTGEPHKRPALVIEDYDVLMKIASETDAIWVTSPLAAGDAIMRGVLVQIPISWLSEIPHAHMTAYYLKSRTLSPTAERILNRLISLSREIIMPKALA